MNATTVNNSLFLSICFVLVLSFYTRLAIFIFFLWVNVPHECTCTMYVRRTCTNYSDNCNLRKWLKKVFRFRSRFTIFLWRCRLCSLCYRTNVQKEFGSFYSFSFSLWLVAVSLLHGLYVHISVWMCTVYLCWARCVEALPNVSHKCCFEWIMHEHHEHTLEQTSVQRRRQKRKT